MKHIRLICIYICFCMFALYATDAQKITAPVSIGELFDKITILEIKTERLVNPQQCKNAAYELESLKDTLDENGIVTSENESKIEELRQRLIQVNKKLWDIENELRAKEAKKEFDEEFIQLARAVYFTNDERCRIKRELNEQTGSTIIEEKQYSEYT